MGMTIDEIIQGIEVIKAQAEWDYPLDWQIVLDGAVDNMRQYQMFQAKYVERLKADMVAMLEELDLTIDEIPIVTRHGVTGTVMTAQGMRKKIKENIQQKINALKGDPQ